MNILQVTMQINFRFGFLGISIANYEYLDERNRTDSKTEIFFKKFTLIF